MKNIIKSEDGFYVDQSGNKFSMAYYTEETAEEASESLINCRNCIDCVDCENCTGCTNCRDCIDCHNCHHCSDCKNCVLVEASYRSENCENCDHCYSSKNCVNCVYVGNSDNCYNCYNCNRCEDCVDCDSCEEIKGVKGEMNTNSELVEAAKKTIETNENQVVFEIIKHIGVIDRDDSGWVKEINLVSWNGADPKVDIRKWNSTHSEMSRGITLTEEEAGKLINSLTRYFEKEQKIPEIEPKEVSAAQDHAKSKKMERDM